MLLLALEYLTFTFVACIGMLQWVALRQRLQGLCFLTSHFWGYSLSILLVVGPFAWFFLSRDRIRPGLEGLQQLLIFSVAAGLALAFTLVATSLIRRGMTPVQGREVGLEALRGRTYLQAWRQRKGNRGAGQA